MPPSATCASSKASVRSRPPHTDPTCLPPTRMAAQGEVTPRTAQAQEDVEDVQRRLEAAQQRIKEGSGGPGVQAPASCNLEKCLMVLGIGNMLTPLDTQAPTPLLPLLITEELSLPVAVVGQVFSAMTLAAMISFVMIMPLSKCLSPRTLLLGDFALRLVSGCFYTAALWGDAPHSLVLPLLYVSRFLYGVTLNSFALPSIWIACRMPVDERPARITAMQAALTLGIILGPTWGSTMASLMPTDWQGYATPGYFTIANCAVLLGLVYKYAWRQQRASSRPHRRRGRLLCSHGGLPGPRPSPLNPLPPTRPSSRGWRAFAR